MLNHVIPLEKSRILFDWYGAFDCLRRSIAHGPVRMEQMHELAACFPHRLTQPSGGVCPAPSVQSGGHEKASNRLRPRGDTHEVLARLRVGVCALITVVHSPDFSIDLRQQHRAVEFPGPLTGKGPISTRDSRMRSPSKTTLISVTWEMGSGIPVLWTATDRFTGKNGRKSRRLADFVSFWRTERRSTRAIFEGTRRRADEIVAPRPRRRPIGGTHRGTSRHGDRTKRRRPRAFWHGRRACADGANYVRQSLTISIVEGSLVVSKDRDAPLECRRCPACRDGRRIPRLCGTQCSSRASTPWQRTRCRTARSRARCPDIGPFLPVIQWWPRPSWASFRKDSGGGPFLHYVERENGHGPTVP